MAKPLQEYARKRDFNATPEPSGKRSRGKKPMRCSSAFRNTTPATCIMISAWSWTVR